MLTVMHISASGDEYVFQAATVLKCRDREATAIKFMVEFHDDRGRRGVRDERVGEDSRKV